MSGIGAGRDGGVSRLAAHLSHDVGKYIARTAHNVSPGDWTPDLAAMLCRDLFDLGGARASALFEARARPIEDLIGNRPELARARGLLAEIDRLEQAVRKGDPTSLERSAALALAVEASLRKLVYDLDLAKDPP